MKHHENVYQISDLSTGKILGNYSAGRGEDAIEDATKDPAQAQALQELREAFLAKEALNLQMEHFLEPAAAREQAGGRYSSKDLDAEAFQGLRAHNTETLVATYRRQIESNAEAQLGIGPDAATKHREIECEFWFSGIGFKVVYTRPHGSFPREAILKASVIDQRPAPPKAEPKRPATVKG